VQVFDFDSFIRGYVNDVLDLNNGNNKKTARQLPEPKDSAVAFLSSSHHCATIPDVAQNCLSTAWWPSA